MPDVNEHIYIKIQPLIKSWKSDTSMISRY